MYYRGSYNYTDINKILQESGGRTMLDFNAFSRINFSPDRSDTSDKSSAVWKQFIDFMMTDKYDLRGSRFEEYEKNEKNYLKKKTSRTWYMEASSRQASFNIFKNFDYLLLITTIENFAQPLQTL